jgi:hypothetical protein
MQRELVAELQAHIAEFEPGSDLYWRLGSPEQYAADLRTAAGLHRRRGPVAFFRARRPRNLIVVVLLLTLLGLAIGGLAWANTYQPLGLGPSYTYPGNKTLTGLEGVQAVFRDGRPFGFGVTVQNNGPFTVRILGVPRDEGDPWTARLTMSPVRKSDNLSTGPWVPFHPVDLPPGHWTFLSYNGVWACHAYESKSVIIPYTDFPVRYSFLWRTVTTRIPLPEPFAIIFPKGCRP